MALQNAFANLALDASVGTVNTSVQAVNTTLTNGIPVTPANTTTKLREVFSTYSPGTTWTEVKGTNDIIQLDGNAAGASYLVISKDPFTTGSESSITTVDNYSVPIELSMGLSMSQRVVGQETAIEFASTETPSTVPADIAISTISQTTTVLTVNTTTAHGLIPGRRISIYGVSGSSFLNFASLVVATIPTATQFLATAGPVGTITTATASGTGGYVAVRPIMGGALNGTSEVFENATATNASIYIRSNADEPIPSGTILGNHSITVSGSAPTQIAVAAYTYAMLPSSEYRLSLQPDRVQWSDAVVDSTGAQTSRTLKTQIVPDPTKSYKLRVRANNNKSLTVPTAKIVSATKTGATTTTIVTDVAHNLATTDYVVMYGISDQTNFPNLTAQTQVLSIVSSTSFTINTTGTGTATAYGGYVAKVNGQQLNAGLLNVALTNVSVTGGILSCIANATIGASVGDYVNVYNLVNSTTGVSLGLDGTYKIADVATTACALIPIGSTPTPGTLISTNTGGGLLKRTDTRINFARIFNFTRERVEIFNRPSGDLSAAVPVQGTVIVSAATVNTASLAASLLVVDAASAAITTTATIATIVPASSALSQEFNVLVTAASGTTPTLDVVVQESDDSGTNWFDTYHFPRITAIGQYRSPLIPMAGNRVRYVQTITGTTPSFTRSINRLQSHSTAPLQRQFFDRTLVVNTINSASPVFFTEGCVDLIVVVSMGAVTTTAPVLVYQGSVDNLNWYQIGADITTVASTNNLLQLTNAQSRFSRIFVKTAGVAATLNYVMIKGTGY